MRKTYRYLTERGYPRTANKDGYSYTENKYEFRGQEVDFKLKNTSELIDIIGG